MERLAEVAREGLRTDIPAFGPGDTIRVMVRVREGDKERLQAFEGLVISKRGGGISENFTVRKVSAGVGVERMFPIHSPTIATLELVRRGRGPLAGPVVAAAVVFPPDCRAVRGLRDSKTLPAHVRFALADRIRTRV